MDDLTRDDLKDANVFMSNAYFSIYFKGGDKIIQYWDYHKYQFLRPFGPLHLAEWLESRKIDYNLKVKWLGIFQIHTYLMLRFTLWRFNNGKVTSQELIG